MHIENKIDGGKKVSAFAKWETLEKYARAVNVSGNMPPRFLERDDAHKNSSRKATAKIESNPGDVDYYYDYLTFIISDLCGLNWSIGYILKAS